MISFKMNFDPRKLERELTKAVIDGGRRQLQDRISLMRCSVHGRPPRIRTSGRSSAQIAFDAELCCDRFREEIQRHLR